MDVNFFSLYCDTLFHRCFTHVRYILTIFFMTIININRCTRIILILPCCGVVCGCEWAGCIANNLVSCGLCGPTANCGAPKAIVGAGIISVDIANISFYDTDFFVVSFFFLSDIFCVVVSSLVPLCSFLYFFMMIHHFLRFVICR